MGITSPRLCRALSHRRGLLAAGPAGVHFYYWSNDPNDYKFNKALLVTPVTGSSILPLSSQERGRGEVSLFRITVYSVFPEDRHATLAMTVIF